MNDIIGFVKALTEIGLAKATRFILSSIFVTLINTTPLFPFRPMLFKLFGARIGKNTVLHKISFFNQHVNGFRNFIAGNNCFVGNEVSLDLAEKIVFEDYVTLANRVLILTHTNVGYKDHPLQKFFPKIGKKVHIKRGAFIGASAIILPGVTIGGHSFIGAGAIVTKNIPEWSVAVGNPAKVIKKIKH